jgi:hypothetical protein
MRSDEEHQPEPDDEIPRQGFWANLPKRSLSRVVLLLALLAGILYLQQRTGTIASCMSDAFHAPPPASSPTVRLKTPGELPARSVDGAP